MPDVRIFATLEELSLHAAEAVVAAVKDAERAGRCLIALSGSDTPKPLHRLLASRFREAIPWPRVHVFWGDERYVPPDDRRSNYRMAQETLLDHVPCPPENVHPMPTHFENPADAAVAYEATLRDAFGSREPRLDLVLLGIGADGHTASLFPRSPSLTESDRFVLAVTGPADPPTRLTLTWPLLLAASNIFVLVSGASKARALEAVLEEDADPAVWPAAAIRRARGTVIWWVDAAAAGY
jgi:6-phosphogluconolactonase